MTQTSKGELPDRKELAISDAQETVRFRELHSDWPYDTLNVYHNGSTGGFHIRWSSLHYIRSNGMAKRKRKELTPTEVKAVKKAEELSKFYDMGISANATGGEYGAKANERIAEEHGVSPSNVGHARTFAALVDQDELAMICALRNPKGDAFGPGMATTLFRLTTKRDRRWLLRFWENGSSARDLKTKVKERFGTVADVKGGRKSTQPTSRSDAIRQLHDRCSSWLGWYDQFTDKEVGDVSVEELPEPVQKQLKATIRAVKKLRDLTTHDD
jgi:hypothetical protein